MLKKTDYSVPLELIDQAANTLEGDQFRQSINRPTGNFFYDPWVILDELKGTIWEKIYDSLPEIKGEARIIRLKPAECYCSHADIDDRWHLNLESKKSYLINLDNEQMFRLTKDGCWYDLDAGVRHTAVNLGNRLRIQLVIRKLLDKSNRTDLVNVKIKTKLNNLEDARFEFDDNISGILNLANKSNALRDFRYTESEVNFCIAPEFLQRLKSVSGNSFEISSQV